MASSGIMGNMVKLQTFMKWGMNNVFGHKTRECKSIIYVNEVYCKVCARNKHAVLANAVHVQPDIIIKITLASCFHVRSECAHRAQNIGGWTIWSTPSISSSEIAIDLKFGVVLVHDNRLKF